MRRSVRPDDRSAEDAIDGLEERVRRFPARRYPVQHATAQFHLGVVLAEAGDLARAEAALVMAAATFDPGALPAEHGKALNALGAVLRMAGRRSEAIQVLVRAGAAFHASGSVAEEGAARFNLGLVRREAGDAAGAAEDLAHARARFAAAGALAAAAAAARELGVAHLEEGRLADARAALEDAIALARDGGDDATVGMAANVLGLVQLADDRPAEALAAFTAAAGAHPRAVRPHDHAMAKANLALAHERAGEALAARVAARQALGVRGVPAAVRTQAGEVLARLTGAGERPPGAPGHAGPPPAEGAGETVALLADTVPADRPALVREELARWLDADSDAVAAEAAAWIDAQLARPDVAANLAAELTAGLLELPAGGMRRVMSGIVQGLAGRPPAQQERFRSQMAAAAARFHVPQLLRLRDAFNAVAAEQGQPATWR